MMRKEHKIFILYLFNELSIKQFISLIEYQMFHTNIRFINGKKKKKKKKKKEQSDLVDGYGLNIYCILLQFDRFILDHLNQSHWSCYQDIQNGYHRQGDEKEQDQYSVIEIDLSIYLSISSFIMLPNLPLDWGPQLLILLLADLVNVQTLHCFPLQRLRNSR